MTRAGRILSTALLVSLTAATATGCGDDKGERIVGLERTPPLEVGAVTLPEVTAEEPGTPFAFKAAPGTLLVAYFGFTNCPDLCPTTLADLRSARRRIGSDADIVDLALVTVDPERDTAEILRNYAGSFADRFHVLRTTDTAELQRAEDAFLASSQVVKAADGTVEVAHSATAYLIDSTGRVLVEWPFGIGAAGMENDLTIFIERIKATN